MATWAEIIDSYREVKGPDECWPWKGAKNARGYGHAYCSGLTLLAHRVAYMVANGEIAEGLIVLHKCDNPICCNPAHLRLGTFLDNSEDAINKGRMGKLNPTLAPDLPDSISTGQAGAIAGVSAQTIINWVNENRFPSIRFNNGPRRIPKREFYEYLTKYGRTARIAPSEVK